MPRECGFLGFPDSLIRAKAKWLHKRPGSHPFTIFRRICSLGAVLILSQILIILTTISCCWYHHSMIHCNKELSTGEYYFISRMFIHSIVIWNWTYITISTWVGRLFNKIHTAHHPMYLTHLLSIYTCTAMLALAVHLRIAKPHWHRLDSGWLVTAVVSVPKLQSMVALPKLMPQDGPRIGPRDGDNTGPLQWLAKHHRWPAVQYRPSLTNKSQLLTVLLVGDDW